jgi:hypothetical protein
MSLTQIGRSSTASVLLTFPTLTSKSYTAQFNLFNVRAVTPPISRVTFANETNPTNDPGDTTYIITFAGLLKKGIDGSNGTALLGILLTNPYAVPGTWQYDTGCSIASTAGFDFQDCSGTRAAGIDAVFSGSCSTTQTVTLAWVIV